MIPVFSAISRDLLEDIVLRTSIFLRSVFHEQVEMQLTKRSNGVEISVSKSHNTGFITLNLAFINMRDKVF